MKIKAASEYFHGKEGYNCIQAVLKVFQPETGMSEATIRHAKIAGGGRVAGGTCGALYAAHIILGEGEHNYQIKSDFIRNHSSLLCSELRVDECRCRELVKTAVRLTQQHLDKVDNSDPDYLFERQLREQAMLIVAK